MRVEREHGYTLIEMLLVVGLLTIVAAIAVPSFNDNNELSLDQTAREVARAIRFAHAEAVRSGEPHGVNASQFSQSIKVYRLDNSVNPPVFQYDVYDPLTKQPYDLRLGSAPLRADIDAVYFKFADYLFPQTSLGFAGGSGIPKYEPGSTVYVLETAYIRLELDGIQRTVSVSPITGRVTVQ